jgi:hypothetical protein
VGNLITAPNMQSYVDKLVALWDLTRPVLGSQNDNPPVAGTAYGAMNNLQNFVAQTTQDPFQELDLLPNIANLFTKPTRLTKRRST